MFKDRATLTPTFWGAQVCFPILAGTALHSREEKGNQAIQSHQQKAIQVKSFTLEVKRLNQLCKDF